MTTDQAKFFKAFTEHMNQYPLTSQQFVKFLDGDEDAVPRETLTALYDAQNLWVAATTERTT